MQPSAHFSYSTAGQLFSVGLVIVYLQITVFMNLYVYICVCVWVYNSIQNKSDYDVTNWEIFIKDVEKFVFAFIDSVFKIKIK